MNKIILLIISVTFSSALFAADGTDIYLGASYNTVSIDFANASVEDSEGIGLVFGIDFGKNLAFETEYINSGKADMDYQVGAIESAKIQVRSLAAYAVFRTTGRVYFKGRAGLAANLVDITDITCSGSFCINSLFDDGAGLAFSAGGGVLITEAMKLELEYKLINSDIDIFSLGLVYAF
jgi:outer membrane immunogenic protein